VGIRPRTRDSAQRSQNQRAPQCIPRNVSAKEISVLSFIGKERLSVAYSGELFSMFDEKLLLEDRTK